MFVRLLFGGAAIIAMVGSAEAQTLQDALAIAYNSNPEILAQREQVRSVDETYAQARAGRLPTVDGNAQVGFQSSRSAGTITLQGALVDVSETDDVKPRSGGATITQNIYSGGRVRAQLRQATAQGQAARAQLYNIEQQIFLAVVTAYTDVRRAEEEVRIRTNNVTVLRRQLQAAQDRFDVGEITRTDVAQAEARRAGAEADLALAQARLDAARANYEQAVGEAPGTLIAESPLPQMPNSLGDAINFALEDNPTILQLEAIERATKLGEKIEFAGFLPQANISVGIRRAQSFGQEGFSSQSFDITTQFRVPLYDAGLTRSRFRQAKINTSRAHYDVEAARRNVQQQVAIAWADFQSAQRQIASAQEQAKANEIAFDGVEQELRVGLRTTLDVLDAEQELLNSRLLLITAQRDSYLAAHRLLQAMGALTPDTLGVNVSLYDPEAYRQEVRGLKSLVSVKVDPLKE
ncbi:MAG TPA: hypothetical protein DCZ49_08625 [Hyphomonadaceae bacterium]|nr:hypothetical protein [Hyphomonadaceae bacterium]